MINSGKSEEPKKGLYFGGNRYSAAQVIEQSQVAKHLLQRDLLAQESKIDRRALGHRNAPRRRSVDGLRRGFYAGGSRGDHFLSCDFFRLAHGDDEG